MLERPSRAGGAATTAVLHAQQMPMACRILRDVEAFAFSTALRKIKIPIACGTTTAYPSAGSFTGGFRTTAPVLGETFVQGRHPKPFTIADLEPHTIGDAGSAADYVRKVGHRVDD